jgi:hypothetical protein
METGYLYNAEWLVWLYAFVGAWYTMLFVDGGAVAPVVAISVLTRCAPKHWLHPPRLPTVSILALAVTANAVFCVLRWILSRLVVDRTLGRKFPQRTLTGSAVLILTIGGRRLVPFAVVLFVYGLATMRIITFGRRCPREVAFVTWILPLLTLFVGSDLVVIATTTWAPPLWSTTVGKMCIPVAARLLLVGHPDDSTNPSGTLLFFQSVRILWLVSFGAGLIDDSTILHPIGLFVVALVSWDAMEIAWLRISKRA